MKIPRSKNTKGRVKQLVEPTDRRHKHSGSQNKIGRIKKWVEPTDRRRQKGVEQVKIVIWEANRDVYG